MRTLVAPSDAIAEREPKTRAALRFGSDAPGAWILVGAVLVLWGLRFGIGAQESGWFALGDAISVAAGIAVMIGAPWLASVGVRRWVQTIVLAVVVLAFIVWAWQQILLAPAYATDELAFDQYAAHLLLAGVDPYRVSLAAAFPRYQVSPDAYTLKFNGSPVTTLSYPALAFLAYVPLLLAGVHAQAGEFVDIAAWAVTILVTWFAVRPAWRPLVLVLVSLSAYVAYAVGGVTDALFVPMLVGVAALLDRFADRRRLGWLAPVLLGCAMAVKQTPWLVAPFLALVVLRLVADREGWRAAWRRLGLFVVVSAVAFAMWQIPFILWDPRAWLIGTLTPFDSSVVPAGQGLVALTLAFGIGGGGFTWLTVLSIVCLLGGLVIAWLMWPRIAWLAFLLPVIALFFATRSFGSYFVNLVPPALVALGRWPSGPYTTSRRTLTWVFGGFGIASLSLLVGWLLSPSPLSVRIVGVHTSGQLATVDRVTLAVENSSSRPIVPRYTAALAGSFSAPWVLLSGRATIPPHTSATVVIGAPNFPAEPSIVGGFQIVTLAEHTIAPSPLYQPGLLHVALVPDAIGTRVPLGQPVILHAELLNRLDQRVRKAGVPVYLGQVVYAQRGLLYGGSSINRSAPGATPVEELTGSNGVASFRIVERSVEADPISFEANLVSTSGFYPYGYSQIVPIRFGPGRG